MQEYVTEVCFLSDIFQYSDKPSLQLQGKDKTDLKQISNKTGIIFYHF